MPLIYVWFPTMSRESKMSLCSKMVLLCSVDGMLSTSWGFEKVSLRGYNKMTFS